MASIGRCIQLWMDDVFEKQMDIDSFIRGVYEQRIRDIRYDEWDDDDDDEFDAYEER